MPAEWAPQQWLWIGFPHLAEQWPGFLEQAQQEIAGFANAVADSGQQVRLVVRDHHNEARARALVSEAVTIERHRYGDIWLRDTGPLVRSDGTALRPAFNGWGEKYLMAGDQTIGDDLAQSADLPVQTADYVLEGGALDGDGTGLVITTEQCLLNPNRNPAMSREDIETALKHDLGFERIVWLGDGLTNDHTDGHVDNLARFVAPGRIALPVESGGDDPNAIIYDDARRRAEAAELGVCPVPSPGMIRRDGKVEPASYVNFAITTHLVVVPTFGSTYDDAGVAAIAELFPGRQTIGLPASAVLAGGGGFHCASQQMPQLASL